VLILIIADQVVNYLLLYVVLTHTTDVHVCRLICHVYIMLLTFLINLSEIYIIVQYIIGIKLKPD